MRSSLLVTLLLLWLSSPMLAQTRHPMMDSQWWVTAGSFLAQRDLKASASGTIGDDAREIDLDGALGLDDSPALFMGELGWQFTRKWGVALQYFRSGRTGSNVLEETIEWQDEIYEVGATIDAETAMQITRIFFARRFRDRGPHSLRIGAGIHYLSLRAELSGEARVDDNTTDFRRSVASAELPIPNLGAWYRYSPNDRWLFTARVDWLSASVGDYEGRIWNLSGGASYRLTDHIGIGANLQFFQLSGDLTEDSWRGDIRTTFTGPYLHINGFW